MEATREALSGGAAHANRRPVRARPLPALPLAAFAWPARAPVLDQPAAQVRGRRPGPHPATPCRRRPPAGAQGQQPRLDTAARQNGPPPPRVTRPAVEAPPAALVDTLRASRGLASGSAPPDGRTGPLQRCRIEPSRLSLSFGKRRVKTGSARNVRSATGFVDDSEIAPHRSTRLPAPFDTPPVTC